ncbi:MAG: NAD(P)H-dependent oxidoreductase [Sphingobacteriaceae bacterium]|nr:MAG: NAD(P)H-dependent oxidoreductase [Sphingobacteriaceae bacterium]
MSIIEKLQWRAAIKTFDNTRKLTPEQLNDLLTAIRLSPSGGGLQPYKIIVVENSEVREKLREASFGQAQITHSSQLIVFAAETKVDAAFVAKYIDLIAKTREIGREHLAGFEASLTNMVNNKSEEERITWAAKQAYIALGVLSAAAADLGIDTCPMEGFQPGKYDEILGLREKGLTSVVIAAVGFRSSEDVYSKQAKVRRPVEELFIHI